MSDLRATPEERAALAALSGLSRMGPRALRAILAKHAPLAAWRAVRDGSIRRDPELLPRFGDDPVRTTERWAAEAAGIRLAAVAAAHDAAGVRILVPADHDWPERLAGDPEPPNVLTLRGDLRVLEAPSCAIVGTRACTADGRRVAHALGRDLAAEGVAVVSGLALGIDAAAHRGCLAARDEATRPTGAPVGVVAGGVDVVYPASHGELYAAVATSGLLLSEVGVGTRPERWRFPARNRLIAALADIVVVVESARRGGSMHTVDSAMERGRELGAVPGPVLSPASEGTNGMLADGVAVIRDAADVLMVLGLGSGSRASAAPGASPATVLASQGPKAAAVYAAVGVTPTPLDDVLHDCGLPLPVAVTELQRLAAAGLVDDSTGGWTRTGRA